MAFLFKSKKNQDRALVSRDGPPSSGSSMQSAAARVKEEKGSRSTPTGSLHSIDNEGSMGSPEQSYSRQRGQSLEQSQQSPSQAQQAQQAQQQQSDLPVGLCSSIPSRQKMALTWPRRSSVTVLRQCNRLRTLTPRCIRGRNGG